MQASTAVATVALVLAAALAIGRAFGDDAPTPPPSAPKTMQKRIDEREAQRRGAGAREAQRRIRAPLLEAGEDAFGAGGLQERLPRDVNERPRTWRGPV